MIAQSDRNTSSTSAAAFFPITTLATIGTLLIIWRYATGGHRLVDEDLDPRLVTSLSKVILLSSGIMFAGAVLSYFYPYGGLVGFFSMAYIIWATARGRFGRWT